MASVKMSLKHSSDSTYQLLIATIHTLSHDQCTIHGLWITLPKNAIPMTKSLSNTENDIGKYANPNSNPSHNHNPNPIPIPNPNLDPESRLPEPIFLESILQNSIFRNSVLLPNVR